MGFWSKSRKQSKKKEPEQPGVEERIILYHTKMEKLKLEEAQAKAKRMEAELAAAHDKLDLANLDGLFNGETDCVVPKWRK